MLYLGEINDSQREAWRQAISVFDEDTKTEREVALYTSAAALPPHAEGCGVRVRLDAMELHRPRQWGACWLAAGLWQRYLQLVQVEEAFRDLKGDLGLRPIHHQLEARVEAHVFISFMAFALHATLRARLRDLAPGLTPRAVLEKMATLQMIDVKFPTTDGRTLTLPRHTEPNDDVKLILERLHLALPPQPRPRLSATQKMAL